MPDGERGHGALGSGGRGGEPHEGGRSGTEAAQYAELASTGPYGVRPGHALITMVEPHPGHERAYNRWYEDDHYIAGAMAMPWMYAGRRWVATRALRELRYPARSAVARPVTAGCYLSTYWITEGRYDEHMRWTVAINKRLNRDGRVHQERTHVFTSFQDHVATVYRDGDAGPRDFHALDHPYRGLVLHVVDAETENEADTAPERKPDDGPVMASGAGPDSGRRQEERRNKRQEEQQKAQQKEEQEKKAEKSPGMAQEALAAWLCTEHLPERLKGSPAAMVTVFRPTPLPLDRMSYVKQVEGVGTRLTLLWFLEQDPRECWEAWFTGLDEDVSASGRGRVELVAPFLPTVPGTDTYVSELR